MIQRMSILAIALSLGVLGASGAFAGVASESVLGTGDAGFALLGGGSLYYDTEYNMFYNPSYVNDFKNWATLEKAIGSGPAGGFVTGIGSINMGVFLDRTIAGTYAITHGATGTLSNTATTATRPLDLIFGMDTGLKWGAGLTVSTASGNTIDLTGHLGADIMGLAPFASYRIVGAPSENQTFFQGGLRFKFGEWVPYAMMNLFSDTSNRETAWGAGLGRNTKVADGVKMYYALSYWMASDTSGGTATRSVIPINLALEGEAASWLTLRGGIFYDLYDTSGPSDNTTVRFGATIHAGKADFEFAVGGAGSGVDATSFDFANGLFTTANLTYHW